MYIYICMYVCMNYTVGIGVLELLNTCTGWLVGGWGGGTEKGGDILSRVISGDRST